MTEAELRYWAALYAWEASEREKKKKGPRNG